jgi:hypothetical protein
MNKGVSALVTQKGYASVDGTITPLDEATVPVTDRGFLYGDSVYEVFRTYGGVPFFGAEHWQRLLRSADLMIRCRNCTHRLCARQLRGMRTAVLVTYT